MLRWEAMIVFWYFCKHYHIIISPLRSTRLLRLLLSFSFHALQPSTDSCYHFSIRRYPKSTLGTHDLQIGNESILISSRCSWIFVAQMLSQLFHMMPNLNNSELTMKNRSFKVLCLGYAGYDMKWIHVSA